VLGLDVDDPGGTVVPVVLPVGISVTVVNVEGVDGGSVVTVQQIT